LVEDTGYPQDRADEAALAAAELLNRLAGGGSVDMGRLLAAASPPVPPRPLVRPVPALAGEVVSYRWPVGGPPAELLGSSPPTGPLVSSERYPRSDGGARDAAHRCRRRMVVAGRPGSAAGRARVIAHRAGRRGQADH